MFGTAVGGDLRVAFDSILALTDLSPLSCHGLGLAESLARRFHARVTVGYVHTRLDVLREFGDGASNAARLRDWVRTEDEAHLTTLAAKYIEKLRLAGVDSVISDSAREGVGTLIERVRPDLVCMATRGRTGLASVLLGSVAEHTIRTSGVPVVVSRGGPFPAHGHPLKLMLALDLIDEPSVMARRVSKLLRPEDELILAHVVESMYVAHLPQPDVPELQRGAHAQLEQIELDPPAPTVRIEVRAGRPAESIIALCGETEADMIVTRTHGRRGFDHLLLGSVSERVARSAEVPVLVFPSHD
jgi:nucleotide-binding universal stress UspA family protein